MERYWLVVLTCFMVAGLAPAQDWQKVQIHGYASQGYLKSDEHDYLAQGSRDGSFAFTEVAINFFNKPIEKLTLGIQIFARDLGTEGNLEPIIDWAVGEYHWRDELGFRIGKIKAPLGMYNKERDAAFLRPTIFLPQSLYSEDFRDITLAYQGFDVYGQLAGSLDYEAFLGTISLDEDLPVIQGLLADIHLEDVLQRPSIDVEHLYGGSLRWQTPLDGFAIAGAYALADLSLEDGVLPIRIEFNDVHIYTLSLEYLVGNFSFASEYMGLNVPVENKSPFDPHGSPGFDPLPEIHAVGWYAMVAYRVNEALQLTYTRDEYNSSRDDRNGDRFATLGLPRHLAWHYSDNLSIRWDINAHFNLKAEVHMIDGTNRIIVDQTQPPSTWERSWNLYAFKASFHF